MASLRLSGAMITLLVLAAVCVQASVPIQPPVALHSSQSAPREQLAPASTSLPLLEVALTPEARSAGLYVPDEFPSEPAPRPNVNQEPLPLSAPGTYLHSAVLIQGKMYIYGGVSSYVPDKYLNDLWMFDMGASEYQQLQGSYVPPLPNRAGLSTGEAKSFAPHDVPEMPGMATAPRREHSAVELLHRDANPTSAFLPRGKSKRAVRVTAYEHLYQADRNKPLASGVDLKDVYAGSERIAAFEVEEEKERQAAAAAQLAQAKELVQALEAQAKPRALNARPPRNTRVIPIPETVMLQTEEHLSLSNAHQARHRMLARTLRAIQDASAGKNPSQSVPGTRAGSRYQDAAHWRDGAASRYSGAGRPEQPAADQTHHAGTRTARAAAPDARETLSHGGADFWSYDFDSHTWEVVGVNSSAPLAHSPWLTPAQLSDPVFKDPLPVLLPPTRRLHTAVVMRDRMLVFGGASHTNLVLGDLWIYSPAEGSWVEASADGPGGSPILPREGHSAVALDDLSMLVFGGVSYGFLPFNDLWSYSAVDNAWYRLKPQGTKPMQRWLHTAVLHRSPSVPAEDKGKMVVFGGVTAHYVPLNDVHVYDVAGNSWSKQATEGTPPFPRMLHSAVTLKDLMIVSGGAANNLPLDDLWVLDLKSWRWREVLQTGGYPFARTGHSTIVLSPRARAKELGELEDLSDDAKDPHLEWKPDEARLTARPIVSSFSSEGLETHEERASSLEGLDAIAFPEHPVVGDGEKPASQRPIYRYRKHSQNNFFLVTFGGSHATAALEDNSHIEQPREPGLHPAEQWEQQQKLADSREEI